ncbi:MAG: hypothetical protein M0Q92_09545 [Methanoregula sp.]|jgi:hypothetical protein|nr:hypothetical protein [Methanoregula sp.]
MQIDVEIKRGFDDDPTLDLISSLDVDPKSFGIISNWSGSYHILEMGDHFRSYIIDSEEIELPKNGDFPCGQIYDQLTHKTYATSVTGNIGQCMAVIFATSFLLSKPGDIVILDARRPFKKRKTPDFLMRFPNISEKCSDLMRLDYSIQLPKWWPVESKARREIINNSREPQEAALLQLISYWRTIVDEYPKNVGYGLITTFVYKSEKKLIVNFILPKNPELLKEKLISLNKEKSEKISELFKSFKTMHNYLDLGETLNDI